MKTNMYTPCYIYNKDNCKFMLIVREVWAHDVKQKNQEKLTDFCLE